MPILFLIQNPRGKHFFLIFLSNSGDAVGDFNKRCFFFKLDPRGADVLHRTIIPKIVWTTASPHKIWHKPWVILIGSGSGMLILAYHSLNSLLLYLGRISSSKWSRGCISHTLFEKHTSKQLMTQFFCRVIYWLMVQKSCGFYSKCLVSGVLNHWLKRWSKRHDFPVWLGLMQ